MPSYATRATAVELRNERRAAAARTSTSPAATQGRRFAHLWHAYPASPVGNPLCSFWPPMLTGFLHVGRRRSCSFSPLESGQDAALLPRALRRLLLQTCAASKQDDIQ
jgi:hypothetical protein